MNTHERSSGHFELSQQEIKGLMESLAGELILHGEFSDNPNVWPETIDGATPRLFTYNLPSAAVKELLYSNNEDVIVQDTAVAYATPHRIEPDDDTIVESISIDSSSHVTGTDTDYSQSIFISRDGSSYEATVNDDKFTLDDAEKIRRIMDHISQA